MMRIRHWFNLGPRVRLQVTPPRPRAGMQVGCTPVVVLLLLVLASAAFGQEKLLVEVVLAETQERVVVEAFEVDSTLFLPTAAVSDLIGAEVGSGPWVSLVAIRAAFPSVVVAWIPLEQRVVIVDRMQSLPASRRATQALVARNRWTLQLPVWSGPFFAAAIDDSLHGLFDVGYSHRGWLSLAGRFDDRASALWGATLSPSSHLFVSYQDGLGVPPALQGRAAAGPLWLAGSFTPHRPVDVQGLLRVGPIQFYGSKQHGTITVQGSQWSVQLARQWRTGRSAMRISVGPSYASPFSFPITQLR